MNKEKSSKVGKSWEPTPAELEFIYSRLDRMPISDILEELAASGFPVRSRGFIKHRIREFNVAKKVLGEQIKKEFDPVLVERRKEHWDELSSLTELLLSFWNEYLARRQNYHGYIITESQLAGIDNYTAACLLDHLKAGFPEEFDNLEDWTDMLKKDHSGVAYGLALTSKRKTFKGKCIICCEWV